MQILKRSLCILLVLSMLFSVCAITAIDASALAPLPHLVQHDEPWGSVVVGYGTISATGCGILSLVNAVGYLTGKRIDVIECAQWAYSVKGFNNIQGNLGTYRLTLYPKVQAKYGAEYGFTVDCNTEDSGWWAGANNTTLKNHLANGGVAIGNIPGHFIAIVDYDPSTNKFHVLDSSPSASRGTTANRGDVWLSESHMSTGNYKLSWFCLLSATGTPADEQDNEKEYLASVIAEAKNKRFYTFNQSTLSAFRIAYDNAVAVYNSASSTSENYKSAKTALENAMNASSAISVGKSYTATPNERTDIYKDDGKRLTDGKKGFLPANTEAYSGLGSNENAVVTVDLGTSPSVHNTYRVFTGINPDWAIRVPAEVKVSVSNDGTNFTDVASTSVAWSVENNGSWTTYVMNLQAEADRTERYVRFTISPNGHIWLDEVEVCGGTRVQVDGAYITGVNKRIASGDCNVFTSAFGELTAATANYIYANSMLLKWSDSDNAYTVTNKGYGTAIGEEITLASDELLIVMHDWETGVTENIAYGSGTNTSAMKKLNIGDLVYLSGVDVENGKCQVAAYMNIKYLSAEDSDPTPDPTPTPDPENDNLALDKSYVTSAIYAPEGIPLYPDENGVTLTNGKISSANSMYDDDAFVGFNINSDDYKTNGYSYITVDLGKVYAVDKFVANVATEYNADAGIYAPSEVTVYVSEDNKTWKKAGFVNPVDTNNVSTIAATVELDKSVSARYVQFRLVAKKSWMFVSEVEVYEGAPVTEPTPVYLVGDVDNSGTVDSVDYLLVKRSCFNTYSLSDEESVRANINADDSINSVDYILIKRIVFGTYVA